MVRSNLRQSFRLDPTMKEKASNDLEFAKYNIAGI